VSLLQKTPVEITVWGAVGRPENLMF
jgi:hypothetical protein